MKASFQGKVTANHVDLFVSQYGDAANRDLLFIHGGPDWDHSYFLPFVAPLSKMFRLTFFDLRGCGQSTKFGDSSKYSLALAADDVAALIKQLQLKDISILGFSFGGRVLMEFLSKHNAQVRSAIFASTTAYTDYQDELNNWNEYSTRHSNQMKEKVNQLFSDKNISNEKKSEKLALLTSGLDIWDLRNAETLKYTLEKIQFSGEWMTAWVAGALKAPPKDFESIIANSKVSTLILHGEKDMRFPVGVAKRLHEFLPGSKIKIIENAGHMAHLEESSIWVNSVTDFILEN